MFTYYTQHQITEKQPEAQWFATVSQQASLLVLKACLKPTTHCYIV